MDKDFARRIGELHARAGHCGAPAFVTQAIGSADIAAEAGDLYWALAFVSQAGGYLRTENIHTGSWRRDVDALVDDIITHMKRTPTDA